MASEKFSQANEEFVSENYQRALELYTEAIEADNQREDFFSNRAQAHLKLGNYSDALRDCDAGLNLNSKSFKAFLKKGTALFHLEDYKNALDAFQEAQKLNAEDNSVKQWIRKCEAETDLANQITSGGDNQKAKVGASGVVTENKPAAETESNSTSESKSEKPKEPPMPSGPKTKYDWYQTHTHVILTILLKNVKDEDVKTNIQEKSLGVTVRLASGSDYSLELDLAHPIIADQSSIKVMKTKIEIKLKKLEGIQWTKLEDDGQSAPAIKQAGPSASNVPQYPSSSRHTKNWDRLAQEVAEEEKNEKPEGDAALNKLFQQIYADGTDEVKKAMMKSFYESGGTVLSTNWNEVGDKKVEVKPPDGMEFKKWQH